MPLTNLEHYLILSDDMDATRAFYMDVLGLTAGERPPFPFDGYWLYLGEQPCVHIASSELAKDAALSRYLEREATEVAGTGSIDHIAFAGVGLADMRERVRAAGYEFFERQVDLEGRYQLFVEDPNDIKIELNFASEEAEAIADNERELRG